MNLVMRGLTWDEIIVYLDDIIVMAIDFQGMMAALRRVFIRFKANNLKLKPKKCSFFKKEMEFLGKKVNELGVSIATGKLDCIKNWPIPKNTKQLQSFLGFLNYHRSHIPNFATTAAKLYALTTLKYFVWLHLKG